MPNEMVEILIRHHLQKDTGNSIKTDDLLGVFCVNSQWRDVGTRLLWTDIVLDSLEMMAAFIKARPSQAHLELVRTLTISFAPFESDIAHHPTEFRYVEDNSTLAQNGNRYTRQLHQHLRSLVTLIPFMSKLEAFSF